MTNKIFFLKINIKTILVLCLFGFMHICLMAQPDGDGRTGEAGAGELLINPWAQSSGMMGANTASVKGVESSFLNVAGLTRTEGTELLFATSKFIGDVSLSAAGFSQNMGEGVLGLSVMSLDFGDIERTTVENPEGTLGTFSAQYVNIGLSYAYPFSYNMSAGVTVKMISEAAAELTANGFAVDAGVHYQTGRNNQTKFGITLKNWGPRMAYSGDGDDITGIPKGSDNEMTLEFRSAPFEIPTLLNIGGSYDFLIYNGESEMFRITLSETFVSNSFSKDQFLTGLEVSWQEIISLRGGFAYEHGVFRAYDDGSTTAFQGSSLGMTVEYTGFALDYAYRPASKLKSVHTIGVRINL